MGAGLAVSEMITSNPALWSSTKTRLRMNHDGEIEPRVVQIAGADPDRMAQAARYNVDHGAQIIDINMGCPAKKVCKVMAGSALLSNENLVERILEAVVSAVDVPVTLKIRTGSAPTDRNGITIAKIAQESGIQALAVHGRTRACGYKGKAEYNTIRMIKHSVNIPVIANGDIDTPKKAEWVLATTSADAIMIGRGAQGRPWLFREIRHYLKYNKETQHPSMDEVCEIMLGHLETLYGFYGEAMGVRIARKHVSWYTSSHDTSKSFRLVFNSLHSASGQLRLIKQYFSCEYTEGEAAA